MIPVNELIRYNFLEATIRLIETKYIKSKESKLKTYAEGAKDLFENYLIKAYRPTDSHIWRKNVLWKEENDLAMKKQMVVIENAFRKYSGRFSFPGAGHRNMSPPEFAEMLEKSGAINESFPYKEIYPIWNLSMMTQVDEYTKDRHMNMT